MTDMDTTPATKDNTRLPEPILYCDSTEQQQRIDFCISCDNLITVEEHTKCSSCDCNISLLSSFKFKSCPIGKW